VLVRPNTTSAGTSPLLVNTVACVSVTVKATNKINEYTEKLKRYPYTFMPLSEVFMDDFSIHSANAGDEITFKKNVNGEDVLIRTVLNNNDIVQIPDETILGKTSFTEASPLAKVAELSTSKSKSNEQAELTEPTTTTINEFDENNNKQYSLNEIISLRMASALDEIKESNKSLVKQLSNTTLPIDSSSEEIKVVYSNDDEDASPVHDLSASCQKVFNAILKSINRKFPKSVFN